MKKLKRVCAVFAASALILGTGIVFPNSALSFATVTTVSAAEESSCLKYSKDTSTNTAMVSGYVDDNIPADGAVTIPDTAVVDGDTYTVTAVGSGAFSGCNKLKSIKMTSVTSVSAGAFAGCTYLESVEMPKVTSVGSQAFASCASLTDIEMPSVASVDSTVFNGCSKLKSVSMPVATSIGTQVFVSCASLESVEMPKVTSVGSQAFASCASLTDIEMPSVTSIDAGAFAGCAGLTSVDVPVVVSIGNSAFASCGSIVDVDLPSVETIDTSAFTDCSNLTRIKMPKVKSVGANAFRNCRKLTGVDLASATTIADSAFSSCGDIVVYVAEGQTTDLTSNVTKKYVVDSSLKLVWNDGDEEYDFAVIVDTDSYGGSQTNGAAYLDEVDALINDTKSAKLEYYDDAANKKDIVFKVKINNKSDNSNEVRGQVQAYKWIDGKQSSEVTYYVTAPMTVVDGEAK